MIIYCFEKKYNIMEDYIKSLMRETDVCKLWKIGETIEIDDTHDIVIFVQVMPNLDNDIILKNKKNVNIFVCNTEQLSYYIDAFIFNLKPFIGHIEGNNNVTFGIIDYSIQNIDILKNNKYMKDQKFDIIYMPYQYKKQEVDKLIGFRNENTKFKKICVLGVPTPRRVELIKKLTNEGVVIDHIFGFRDVRDKEVMKYKILLNLSSENEYKIYEHIRCDRLIFSKMVILSEMKNDMDKIDVGEMINWTETDDIIDNLVKILKNFNEHKNKITDDKLNEVWENRKKMFDDFIQKYETKY
jgi:hypothetical protein